MPECHDALAWWLEGNHGLDERVEDVRNGEEARGMGWRCDASDVDVLEAVAEMRREVEAVQRNDSTGRNFSCSKLSW